MRFQLMNAAALVTVASALASTLQAAPTSHFMRDVAETTTGDSAVPPADSTTLPISDPTGDGVVDAGDLLAMINAWGACPPLIDVACTADLNGDQNVDSQDLLILMRTWS